MKIYRKTLFVSFSSCTYWLVKLPCILCVPITAKIRHISKKQAFSFLKIENELRKATFWYGEKDKQTRTTVKSAYCFDERVVKVKVRFEKKTTESEYDSFRETIKTHTAHTTDLVMKDGWGYFDVVSDYDALPEYEGSRQRVSIGTGFYGLSYWEFASYPHMLVTGETGQGKTTFIRYVLNGLFSAGLEVYGIDGKGMDYYPYRDSFRYYATIQHEDAVENILDIVRKFRTNMQKRINDMISRGVWGDYMETKDLEPKILLFDEYLAFIMKMSDKDKVMKAKKAALEADILDIIMRGRACGYNVILSLQRADAKYLGGGAIRDNFMCRIVLGSASDDAYRMMFGEVLKGFEKGKAWYELGNERSIIAIPYYKDVIKNETVREAKKKYEMPNKCEQEQT